MSRNTLFNAKMAGPGPALTRKQWEELERCARSNQPTYGKGRTRTQNILRAKGLVAFLEHVVDGDICRATCAGHDALKIAGVKVDLWSGAGGAGSASTGMPM